MKNSTRWIAAALLGGVLLAGVWWWQGQASPDPAAEIARVPATDTPAPAPAPVVRLQRDKAPPAEPLPTLDDSDTALAGVVAGWFGESAWKALFQPERVIRRIVATVDNLPRQDAPVKSWPLRPAPGWLVVMPQAEGMVLGADNARRYAARMDPVRQLDAGSLVAVYLRFYPLFQQAYEDLGYPGAYFNDRLRLAIDDLLATPEPTAPLWLVQNKVRYSFADADLERRSAGQKILLRLGTDNARVVKAKLRDFRSALAAHEKEMKGFAP